MMIKVDEAKEVKWRDECEIMSDEEGMKGEISDMFVTKGVRWRGGCGFHSMRKALKGVKLRDG